MTTTTRFTDREALLAAALTAINERVVLVALTNYEGLTLRNELITRGADKRDVLVVSAWSKKALRGLTGRMMVDPEIDRAIEEGTFRLGRWWEFEQYPVEASLKAGAR